MALLHADPSTLHSVITNANPGDTVELSPGQYGALNLLRIKGRPGQPIEIKGTADCVFEGGQRYEDFRREANKIARQAQIEGRYPSLGRQAHRGFIRLKNCAYLTLSGFTIRGCWPTGIYISNGVGLRIDGLDIAEGTFGIFADGRKTRDLTITNCHFVQDIERGRIWREIDWKRIHDGDNRVSIKKDARAFDGEFFRSFGISGDVTISHNLIEHAFNGIHMYHSDRDGEDRFENRDVRIFGNTFRYIRDNAIEPEWGATNWWIFHNKIENCHKWYSLQVRRSGHFYIFGNVGFFDELPGPPKDKNKGGAVFKLDKKHIGTEGKHYVFNNSYYLRSAYIKKSRMQNFVHFNNAITYCDPPDHTGGVCYLRGFFGGALGDNQTPPPQFTTDWIEHNIRFVNDVIHHSEYPDALRSAGYPIETAISQDPGFTNPAQGDFSPEDGAVIIGKGIAQAILLVDGSLWHVPSGTNAGAWQGSTLLQPPSQIPSVTGHLAPTV